MHQASLIAQTYRITRVFFHTIVGLVIASVFLPFLGKNTKLAIIKWWCGGLLRAFHIKVVTFGEVPPITTTGVMFVANHISWSDIHALNSKIALRFIAKSEIRSWPVFGYLVEKANTLFIDRSKRQDAGKIVDITSASLISGDNLCFFPEGTTTDGRQVLPFKSSVLQAAIVANSDIWPVAIRYVNLDGSMNTNIAYAGETSLIDSMHQVIKQKFASVELHFLQPISTTGKDRRQLTQAAYDAIVAKLA